jgi:hypothetical protein
MGQDSVYVSDMKIGDSFIVKGKPVKLISKSLYNHLDTQGGFFSLEFQDDNSNIENQQPLYWDDEFKRDLAKIDDNNTYNNNKSKEEKKSPDEITVSEMKIGDSYVVDGNPRKLKTKNVTIFRNPFSRKKKYNLEFEGDQQTVISKTDNENEIYIKVKDITYITDINNSDHVRDMILGSFYIVGNEYAILTSIKLEKTNHFTLTFKDTYKEIEIQTLSLKENNGKYTIIPHDSQNGGKNKSKRNNRKSNKSRRNKRKSNRHR